MKKVVLWFSAILLFSYCTKEDDSNIFKNNRLEYLPMAVGNYWIYQSVRIDTNQIEIIRSGIDSVYITHDSIVEGKKYYGFESRHKNDYGKESQSQFCVLEGFYRDSSGFLINLKGKVIFSQNNFTDTLYRKSIEINSSSMLMMTAKMETGNTKIAVPAGSFDALNLQITAKILPQRLDGWNLKYLGKYFAKNAGVVLNSYCYVGLPDIFELRLLRYEVKN